MTEKLVENKHTYIYKTVITDDTTKRFNQSLYWSDWAEIETCYNPSERYKLFIKKFLFIYENVFPRKKIKVKNIQSCWITSGIKKSPKRKQKFFKTRSQKSEVENKNYKNLFETIKKSSTKLHYSKLIIKYKEDIKKHGQ